LAILLLTGASQLPVRFISLRTYRLWQDEDLASRGKEDALPICISLPTLSL
jgi:hypothetical protein